MYSIDHRDLGTPPAKSDGLGHARNRRRDRHRPRGHVGHAGRGARRHADPEAVRHRYAEGLRLLPPVPGRDRGAQGLPGLLHDDRRARHEGPHALAAHRPAAPRRGRALRLRSPARLRRLPGERPLRAAGHGRSHRRHRFALGAAARPSAARHRTSAIRTSTSTRTCASSARAACAPATRCRARSRSRSRAAASARGCPRASTSRSSPPSACPAAPASRPARPPRCSEKSLATHRPARTRGHDHLRLLRRRLLAQGRDQGRAGRPHGAEPRRRRQPGPRLRQGPLRLRLRDAQGSRDDADDPRAHHGSLARGELGRGHRVHRARVPPHPGEVRPELRRRHHLLALHQRGNVPGPEAGARGASAPTTSTPARASAIRRPATASSTRSASPPARRPSRRCRRRTSSSSSAPTRPTATRCSPRSSSAGCARAPSSSSSTRARSTW